ncbi:hypothetical protein RRF57_010459 [Xylaria bambusicola]|uniref:Nop domain-containing protein n=1 Tax=Xylaria bambusicola TaxID=326684 RepID=A0AAN7ZCM4_9PEZI
MSTLVDELLQDFEDSGSENSDAQNDARLQLDDDTALSPKGDREQDGDMMLDGDEEEEPDRDEYMGGLDDSIVNAMEDQDAAKARVEKMQLANVSDVRKVTNVMDRLDPLLKVSLSSLYRLIRMCVFTSFCSSIRPDRFAGLLQDISRFQSKPLSQATTNVGNIEDNPEYKILTESNTLSTQIDGEIMKVHKFIRDHYSARFPELETLIQNPIEYAKVVAILGNGPMDSDSIRAIQGSTNNALGETLKSVLDGPSLMVVTVEATTSKGHEITQDELERILRACHMMIKMDKAKKTLTEYVQSRMSIFAPNLTAVIGSLTAAQLINTAGGLTNLSRVPACNIAAWGTNKSRSAAFATNTSIRQQGYLYFSPIIRGIPNDLKKKAMKAVASKLVLAARADTSHAAPDGSYGEELRAQCLERLDKITEPPPNKGQRALPAPDDKPSRKRGGRRARKAKEATAMTELRKAQNRMAFGKEEKETGYGTGDSTVGMGMIGQTGDGRIRGMQIDNRTRAKLSQKHKGGVEPRQSAARHLHCVDSASRPTISTSAARAYAHQVWVQPSEAEQEPYPPWRSPLSRASSLWIPRFRLNSIGRGRQRKIAGSKEAPSPKLEVLALQMADSRSQSNHRARR